MVPEQHDESKFEKVQNCPLQSVILCQNECSYHPARKNQKR